MKKHKIVLTVMLIAIMLVGNICTVLAGSAEVSQEFSNSGCTAYYDAYCMASYGSASTIVYVDNTASVVALTAAIDLYVARIEDVEAGLANELIQPMEFWGSDVAISKEVYSGRASADSEVYVGSGYHGWWVETYHSVWLKIGSNSFSGDKTFEFGY